MRPFDWPTLLKEQHIHYVESGPNVKRGELAIQCPFCGSADPSHHMGLNLETGWWSCWRNRSQHSGKSPIRLIMQLLRVPYGRAREIAGLGDDYVDPEGFDALAARLLRQKITEPEAQTDRRVLHMDPAFREVLEDGRTRHHWYYLYNRGFDGTKRGVEDVDHLCREYKLMAGVTGSWTGRIICPFYENGELVTWTGRAITSSSMRYKDLSIDESICPPKHTFFNHDAMLMGGTALVIQEGPFDVLKVDYYGAPWGVRSVGLSTNSLSEQQAYLLKAAEGRFNRIVVMMDTKSRLGIVDSMRMKQELAFLGAISIQSVPFDAGDGGNMTKQQVREWAINGAIA